MRLLGIIASSLFKTITDTFNRVTSGSLGTSSSGSAWEAIKGTWYADGSSAKSDDAASNYSIAAISLSENSTTSVSVSVGTGVAFWVTDANSWWASTSRATQSSTCDSGACSGSENYTYYTYPSTCSNGACSGTYTTYTNVSNCNNGACGGIETYTATRSCSCTTDVVSSWGTSIGRQYECTSADNSIGFSFVNGGTCTFRYSTCSNNACSGTEPYTATRVCSCTSQANETNCSCPQTSNIGTRSCSCTYAYFLTLIKSVGGTVSSAASTISLSSQAAAIAVSTQGNNITATAYSDTAMTSSLNSISHTASSPTTSPKSGIIKAPSSSSQGSTVDNFRITT